MSIFTPEVEETGLPLIDAPVDVVPPFVNLLPVEIIERRALRRLTSYLAAGVLAAVAVTGGLVYTAGAGKADAQASLATQQAETARLQTQLRGLSAAKAAQTQLQAAQTALKAAMADEVLWSGYLDQMRLRLPDGVRLTNVGIAPANAGGSAATGATSAAGATTSAAGATTSAATGSASTSGAIATITVSGKAISQDAVADWLDALPKIKGFTNSFLTNTAPDGQTGLVGFTVTVDVTRDALSHRYDSQSGS